MDQYRQAKNRPQAEIVEAWALLAADLPRCISVIVVGALYNWNAGFILD
jgi:hypothetical protein